MFTVLIQNEKTLNSFYDHLPIFNGFLQSEENEKSFEICEWNESGRTIEEALPELHSLTDDKSSWRALIVRYDDDRQLASHATRPENPYDFIENAVEFDASANNPLIRLVSMLEKPLEYFNPDRASKNTKNFPKYEGVLPESITLITVRHTDELIAAPEALRILNDDDFVLRNGYPSLCRFAVCDRYEQGPIRKRKDDFIFWNAVLMLAMNRVDSAFMQAYKLYSLSLDFNTEDMNEVWSSKIEDIQNARYRIDHFLNNQSIYLERYEGNYPDYCISAQPIDLSVHGSNSMVHAKDYQAYSSDPSDQASSWIKKARKQISEVESLWNSIPDKVQEKSPVFSRRGGYQKKDVDVLSPRQRDQLEAELIALREKVNEEYRNLPDQEMKNADQLLRQASVIEEILKNRPSKSRILIWTISLVLVDLLAVIPAWLAWFKVYKEGLNVLSILSLVLLFVPILFCLFITFEYRKSVAKEIRNWNDLMSKQYHRLHQYLEKYVVYESDLLSYRNGKSYLDLSRDVKEDIHQDQRNLEKSRSELMRFEMLLKKWAAALGVNKDAHKLESRKEDGFYSGIFAERTSSGKNGNYEWLDSKDFKMPQVQKQLFHFEMDQSENNRCFVNETGRKVYAPFSFIEKIHIENIRGRNAS